MTDSEQRNAARQFMSDWLGRGDEKQETQQFWTSLLQRVYGVEKPENRIRFEKPVLVDNMQTGKKTTKFIDAYIPETRVVIEQKSADLDLNKSERQSDGSLLTPYQQARRYGGYLNDTERPRWTITCNFQEFQIYDMKQPDARPEILLLKNFEKEYHRLNFLVNSQDDHTRKEMEVSISAGKIVGLLYDAFSKKYADPDSEDTLKSLNKLCVRLVFCLYAEDAGIFGHRGMFHDYLAAFETNKLRKALVDLFRVLDTPEEKRDRYLKDDDPRLAAFPYVNGGLFADEDIEIPPFTEEIRDLLLKNASEDFDWSEISPTIFGAVFESTLNPETRRKGGMHYTSIENIHKVIDPLFLDDLKQEFSEICALDVENTKRRRLEQFQNKLAGLTFLDPACGSGNFLTETYLSLRRLENQAIAEMIAVSKVKKEKSQVEGQILMGGARSIDVKVSISQFYGIEINDFAVTVAKTALWIAESQMLKETESIVLMHLDFLPLKTNAYIIEGNALRLDWESIVPKNRLSYIMGNPPFVGGMYMTQEQKADIRRIFGNVKGAGEFDYVCAWYKITSDYIKENRVQAAFVSTNSICQGESVLNFWKYLFETYRLKINYAYTTFFWNSEADSQAKVHCIIVGFSCADTGKEKRLYDEQGRYTVCKNISPYLTNSENCFIETRSAPLCNVPPMRFGSMPRDGGGFILTAEEKAALVEKEPLAQKWIHPYIGATEFLNRKERYCLWLVGASSSEILKCPTVKARVEAVREFRSSSKAAATRKFAETPTLFCQIAQPESDYIIVPKTSSGKRKYIPLGFMDKDTIASDLVFLIPDADIYEFGILMSNVHNAWVRTVCGRLKSDYRYSKDIVYNNFPWPNADKTQREAIEQTAKGILDAREQYPESTLAEMYSNLNFFPLLKKAHQQNDRAVMDAYGFVKGTEARISESACVAELMKLYQKLAEQKK